MRKTLILAAVLLSAAPAAAQQFPTTFPPNTLYGRLGFSSGPGQAIPIANVSFWSLNNNGADIYNNNTGKVGIGVGASTAPSDTLDVVGSITTRRSLLTNIGGTISIGAGAYKWQLLGNQITNGDLLLNNPGGTHVLLMPQTGGCVGIAGSTLPSCNWTVDVGSGSGNAGVRINGGGFVAGQGPVLTFAQGGTTMGQIGSDCYLVSSPCNTDLVVLGLNTSRMATFYQWGGVNVLNTSTMNPTIWGGGAFNVRTQNSNNLVGGNGIWVQSTDDTNVRNLPVAITSHMISLQAGNSDWGHYAHCDLRASAECATIEGSASNTQGAPNAPPAASASTPTMPFNSALKMTCGQTLSNSGATHYSCSVGLWGKYYLGNGGQQFLYGIYLDEGFASTAGIFVNATSTQTATTGIEVRQSGTGKALVARTMGAGVSTNHAFEVQDSGGSAVAYIQNDGKVGFTGGTINSLTALSVADSSGFNFSIASVSSPAMTANRTLTFNIGNAARALSIQGDVTFAANFTTSGAFATTLTVTNTTNATIPAGTVTLVDLASSQALTNKTISGLTVSTTTGTLTITNGKTLSISNTLTFAGTDSSTLNIGTGGTLGTAAFQNTGTSGGNVPLLNGSGIVWSNSATWGGGSGQVLNTINGGNSGTAGGSALYFQNGGSLTVGIGGKSAILGGAYDGSPIVYGAANLHIYGNGTESITVGSATVQFPTVSTTASAANAFLDNAASNSLLRSTSSLRYKTNVASLSWWDALPVLLIDPISFNSLASADDPHRKFEGLAAEQVARFFPQFINYDEQGRPDGVQYDRVAAVPMLLMLKLQTAAIIVLFGLFLIAIFVARRPRNVRGS